MKKIDIMLDSINELFCNNGYASHVKDEKIELSLDILGEAVKINVSIPENYPYSFLEVMLSEKNKLSFKVPHMIIGNRLCLFDEGSDRHDYKKYHAIALETIERAINLLQISKKGVNSSEYHHEFLDLWGKNQIVNIYSMVESYDKPLVLDSYFCESKNDDKNLYILAKSSQISMESVVNIIDNLSLNLKKVREKSVYLPIQNTKLTKPIETVKELQVFLENESCYPFFLRHLKKNMNNVLDFVILGIKNDELPIRSLIALSLSNLVLPKGELRKSNAYKGILTANGSKEISQYSVNDLSNTRVFTRGGSGISNEPNKAAYVVGCGSLGSFISKALSDTGDFSKFILHDNQLLANENIGRHLCGLDCVGYFKSLSVSARINSSYPAIEIQTLQHSFYQELLGKEENLLKKNYDVLIIATGDENIEEEIIHFLEDRKLNKPTIIAWVEPFLIVGHALILNANINEKTKQYIFGSNGNINIGVISNPEQFSKAEAGCQSRFMPYSGFEMQLFSQNLVDQLITKGFLNKPGNYHYSWFGKMKEARKNDIEMLPQWSSRNDREIYINRIDE